MAVAGEALDDQRAVDTDVLHTVAAYYWARSLAHGEATLSAADHMTATFNAQSVAGRIEGGYRFGDPFYGVTPYAAVQVQNVFTPDYTETLAAGGTSQTFQSKGTTSTRTELGSWVDSRVNGWTLRGRAAWVQSASVRCGW